MDYLKDQMSETVLKWRYKAQYLGKPTEKSVADYNTSSSTDTGVLTEQPEGNTKEENPDSTDATLGAHPCVKTYYEGPRSSQRYKNWVDYPPKQLSKSGAKAQDRVAIKVFRAKDYDKPVLGGHYSLKYHMIEIQNLSLVATLAPILKKDDVNLDVYSPARFSAPFRPLFFCYNDIVAKYKSLPQEDFLKTFMFLLIKVMDEVFEEVKFKKSSLQASGLISFDIAWAYFAKDTVVLSQGANCEVIVKAVSTTYEEKGNKLFLMLTANLLKFNGEAFVWEESVLEIPEFEGNRLVTDLQHFPLKFHKDEQSVIDRLTARGRMVLDYQSVSYCTYDGIAIHNDGKKMERFNVDGRILIDIVGYNKYHLMKGEREGKDYNSEASTVRGTGRQQLNSMPGDGTYFYLTPDESLPRFTPSNDKTHSSTGNYQREDKRRLSPEEQQRNKDTMLACPEDLKFMTPFLEGFCLKNKMWFMFFVEDIGPITWNDEAFDHLVYDEQQKDLILSFVESHGPSKKQQLEDVIMGKGQGLVMLLSGPPGTGKTLTAEAVADRTRRPLFYLQAEDLGINAATLGANLKNVFDLAAEWKAVILLDEADVFMAERHPHDIARNELVSIFLRELEYTRCIVLLTTNMFQTIDPAFRSRLSMHLLFKPLAAEARAVIWRKFLDRIPGAPIIASSTTDTAPTSLPTESGVVDVSDADIKDLAQWSLNGREIKTAVKMVKSWCDHKNLDVTLARLENGIKVTSPHASKLLTNGDIDLYDD